ncbi:MAG: hypothetical protein DHS20C16_03490 [Phycisphaerae bacterium]|nr:MAG: hypothetical protein DHS20C16_03490 [Phycisphaerae bacterium]
MRTKLQNKIDADMAAWEAIVAQAETEDRNISEEELTTIDDLKASIESNKQQLASLEDFEAVKADLNKPQRKAQPADGPVETFKAESDNLPAKPHNYGNLKVFKNDGKTAYRAGRWLAATKYGSIASQEWCQRNGVELGATTMVGGTDNIGGSTVPDEFLPQIQETITENGVFRKWANVVPMASDVQVVPVKTAGMAAAWEGQGDAIAEKNSTWKKATLTANKAAILTRLSSELAEDSAVALVDNLFRDMALAFALAEDTQGFVGSGSPFTGVAVDIDDTSGATYAASIHTAASGNLAFSDFTITDFVGVVGKLPQFTGIKPAWFISKAGWAASMARLQLSAGGVNVADIAGGPGVTFLGYPVVFTDVMNKDLTDDASAIKCLFGDLSMTALLGTRNGIQLKQSSDRYFDEDEIALRGTERVAINVHSLGSDIVTGPMIALKTPAS